MENCSVPHSPWSGFCISILHFFYPHQKKCPCKDKEALVTFLIGVCTEGIQPTALLLHLNTFSCDERVFLTEFWDSVLGVCSFSGLILKEKKKIIAWIAVYSKFFVACVLFCFTFLMKGNNIVPASGHFCRKPSIRWWPSVPGEDGPLLLANTMIHKKDTTNNEGKKTTLIKKKLFPEA